MNYLVFQLSLVFQLNRTNNKCDDFNDVYAFDELLSLFGTTVKGQRTASYASFEFVPTGKGIRVRITSKQYVYEFDST